MMDDLDSPTDFDEYEMNADDCAPDIDCDDGDDGQALASAGFGTDEDYGGGCDDY